MNKGNGTLIVAGLIVAAVGWIITTEIVDFLGVVLIVAGVAVGVIGLIKVFADGESS